MHSEINDYEVYDPEIDENYDEQWDENQEYEAYIDEDDYYEEEVDFLPARSGGRRVLRLGLMLLVLILIASVILFGVIPYVEAMTNNAPPLPPPVQA